MVSCSASLIRSKEKPLEEEVRRSVSWASGIGLNPSPSQPPRKETPPAGYLALAGICCCQLAAVATKACGEPQSVGMVR